MTREQRQLYDKARYRKNREATLARVKAYNSTHRDKKLAYGRNYAAERKAMKELWGLVGAGPTPPLQKVPSRCTSTIPSTLSIQHPCRRNAREDDA